MEPKIKKQFKSYVSEIKIIDGEERTLTALVSTATKDRMDEVLDPNGVDLKSFKKNPVVLFQHDTDNLVIGKAVWIKKVAEGVLSKVQFAKHQLAEDVFNLFKGGFMKAFSVGFIPREWKIGNKDSEPRRTYTEWELVEFSAVAVPANPDALVTALKTKAIDLAQDTQKLLGVAIPAKKIKEPDKKEVKNTSDDLIAAMAEIKQLQEKLDNVDKDNEDLRYKLYVALYKPKGTLSEIADNEIVQKIDDAVVGAIKKVTGKVS